jgi:DNA-binding transcriptional MocR family regulator
MPNHELNIPIDRESEEPIYRQLIRQVRAQIDSGALATGTRLPASRELADSLAISRISVVNAYAELRASGYLSAHAGRGTFVAGSADTLAPAPASNGHTRNLTATLTSLPAPVLDKSLRELMNMARKPGIINFGPGAPPIEFIPVMQIRDAMNHAIDRDGSKAFGYESPEGYAPLRASVRDYVSAFGIQCSSENVLITGGTQQGIDLVMQSVLGEHDVMATEDPTYLGVLDLARTRRMRISPVPHDQDGIRLDILENYLLDHQVRLIYVMPTFHNPTGGVMPLHRRRQLLALAQQYRVPILEDGVYNELRFEGDHLPPLKALDEHNNVIHVSGFTKNLVPGLRIGYIIAQGSVYERLARVKATADISSPGLNQRAIQLLLEHGTLARQMERNNHELRRRRDAAVAALERHLPSEVRWTLPRGGLYLWLELPREGPNAAELYLSAVQMGVAYAMGTIFYANGGGAYHLRINYGAQRPEQIEEGFRRLGRAWRELSRNYADYDKALLL